MPVKKDTFGSLFRSLWFLGVVGLGHAKIISLLSRRERHSLSREESTRRKRHSSPRSVMLDEVGMWGGRGVLFLLNYSKYSNIIHTRNYRSNNHSFFSSVISVTLILFLFASPRAELVGLGRNASLVPCEIVLNFWVISSCVGVTWRALEGWWMALEFPDVVSDESNMLKCLSLSLATKGLFLHGSPLCRRCNINK